MRLPLLALVLLSASIAFAVQPSPSVDNDFVQKQFGSSCKLEPGFSPIAGDLDGDGIEDVVIPARCRKPMLDQAENNFRVVDPYYTFFGYGNPKITSEFASEDPVARGVVLLVIHGAGPEAWHSETPKAKFMIINFPYKTIAVKKMAVHKRTIMAIYAEETGADQMESALFWDGKKYRYTPLGSGME
ncbi:MAG TPA: hypothetical protein VJQ82_00790 [Terriglobales bacterium]|nr:hypothetical protein [Terriglobales bacterium]